MRSRDVVVLFILRRKNGDIPGCSGNCYEVIWWKKDAANYSVEGKFYGAGQGEFFIFFPSDAHRPNITPRGNKVVKKIVIKVRVAG